MQYIECKPLEKIAEITRGVSWKSGEESSEKSFESIRAYKIPHIIKNKKYVSEDEPLYIKKYKKHEAKLLTYNDILMITSNGNPNRVGNISLYKSREIAVPASFLLKISGKEVVEQEFLYYFLSSDKAQSNITGNVAGSTGLRNINMSSLKGLKVPVPPLKEQQKIAEILSTVDEQIEQTDQLIEKTKEIKKGLMQQLLTKGINHTEFKNSELGEIPAEWEITKIGNVAQEKSERAKEKNIEVLSVTKHKGIVLAKEYFNKVIASKDTFNYKIVHRGELAYATVHLDEGSIGLSSYDKGIVSPMYTVFDVKKDKINNQFLFNVLKSHRMMNIYQNIGQGGVNRRRSISFKKLAKVKITLPTLKEQEKIVKILSAVDKDIEGYEQEKAKYEELKKGLMQQLLTGKIRVKVD